MPDKHRTYTVTAASNMYILPNPVTLRRVIAEKWCIPLDDLTVTDAADVSMARSRQEGVEAFIKNRENLIPAIKALRDVSGMGLKEAKDTVDAFLSHSNPAAALQRLTRQQQATALDLLRKHEAGTL
jgi:ribosomal protein L7/L12